MTLKEYLKSKDISEADFKEKSVEEVAQIHNEWMQKEIKSCATKEEVKKVKKTINDFLENAKEVSDETIKAMKEAIENQNDEIVKLKEKGNAGKTTRENILEKIKDIKSLIKGQDLNVVIKAPTVRASVTNSTQGFMLPNIGQLGVKERSIYDSFPKIQFPDGDNNGKIKYIDWDEATIARAAASVAEGVAFPESTAKFAEYSIDLKKIGDSLPVSEEFGEDQHSASAELNRFLDINVNAEVDRQLAVATGVGQDLLGLENSVPTYTPLASGIVAPNIRDLAIKVSNDITSTRGSKYKPNTVYMNSGVFEAIQFAKDTTNNYIFNDTTGTIGGLNVVIDNNLSANSMIVGDSRFGTIYEKGGVTITKGLQNAQFGEDMITLKARKRMLFLIRESDKTGFRRVTSISAALTSLAL